MAAKILVADDEATIRKILQIELEQNGYEVVLARDGQQALAHCRAQHFDAALLDVRMPGLDGYHVLRELHRCSPGTAVIMITAFGTIDGAVEAMKSGADEYITKPFDGQELLLKLGRIVQYQRHRPRETAAVAEERPTLIGEDYAIRQIKSTIAKIKSVDTTVLLVGESGTGKGVVAKEIHQRSDRCAEPFVHVDCAFLPPSLIESELFGHEKGAFTNALGSKKGKFELAGRGTLFLDEIGTMPFDLQSKLLNVLQERSLYRIGGSFPVPMEARVVAATNENLEQAVRDGRFRGDLYYRLNVVRIECPPLRHRRGDIPQLARHFFEQHAKKAGRALLGIDPAVYDALCAYDWPGNVRELENAIESAVVLCDADELTCADLPLRVLDSTRQQRGDGRELQELSLKDQELMAIVSALEKHNGHREKTAAELGISRRTLQYKLKKFNLL